MQPEHEACVQTGMRALLTQLELNKVRHWVVDASEQETHESYIAIHPEDRGALMSACQTLGCIKLIRAVGVAGESQVILANAGDGMPRYSVIRVIPVESHTISAREPWYSAGVASLDCKAVRRDSLGNREPLLRRRTFWHSAKTSAQGGLQVALRGVGAWVRPNGLFCVLLGPDGVGKSTTIQRLQLELQALFGPCTKARWRPGIVRKVKPDSSNRMPHTKSLRGAVTSAFFVLGLALDFSIGYAVSAYPAMARSETIIFDRYFHDLLIDPKRYRYAGPMWLPRLISRFIPPRKALFIILDAEEEVILSRKQELPPHELRRQRNAYKIFSSRASNSMIVSTDKSLDEIVAEIVDKILEILASRNVTSSVNNNRVQLNSALPPSASTHSNH